MKAGVLKLKKKEKWIRKEKKDLGRKEIGAITNKWEVALISLEFKQWLHSGWLLFSLSMT